MNKSNAQFSETKKALKSFLKKDPKRSFLVHVMTRIGWIIVGLICLMFGAILLQFILAVIVFSIAG